MGRFKLLDSSNAKQRHETIDEQLKLSDGAAAVSSMPVAGVMCSPTRLMV